MLLTFRTDDEFVKQEMEISGEYVEDDKQYQTEGDEEIGNYESGSQDNGKLNANRFDEFNWNKAI